MIEKDCHVYVIASFNIDGSPGPIKVGLSDNPKARLRQLQTGSPFRMELVAVFSFPNREIARAVEAAFHQAQKKWKTSGEWFDLKVDVAVFVMCLNIKAMVHFLVDEEIQETVLRMTGVPAVMKARLSMGDAHAS